MGVAGQQRAKRGTPPFRVARSPAFAQLSCFSRFWWPGLHEASLPAESRPGAVGALLIRAVSFP